jgi:hypothetical protein
VRPELDLRTVPTETDPVAVREIRFAPSRY